MSAQEIEKYAEALYKALNLFHGVNAENIPISNWEMVSEPWKVRYREGAEAVLAALKAARGEA